MIILISFVGNSWIICPTVKFNVSYATVSSAVRQFDKYETPLVFHTKNGMILLYKDGINGVH